VTISSLHLF